ncbi:skin secretory protein xP2-like [Equus przewalskii]|uniref:Skin secretory protein xP2-like n=1 Tax=Equus przewalskii TaxID=9798 RepID=A0ABM4PZY1_EQUPR
MAGEDDDEEREQLSEIVGPAYHDEGTPRSQPLELHPAPVLSQEISGSPEPLPGESPVSGAGGGSWRAGAPFEILSGSPQALWMLGGTSPLMAARLPGLRPGTEANSRCRLVVFSPRRRQWGPCYRASERSRRPALSVKPGLPPSAASRSANDSAEDRGPAGALAAQLSVRRPSLPCAPLCNWGPWAASTGSAESSIAGLQQERRVYPVQAAQGRAAVQGTARRLHPRLPSPWPPPTLGEPASDEEAAAEARTPAEERPWRGSWAPRVRGPSGGSGPEWAAGRPRGPCERGARAAGPAPSEGGAQPRGLGLSQRVSDGWSVNPCSP